MRTSATRVEGAELLTNQTITQTGAGVYVLDRVEFTGPIWGMFGVRSIASPTS